MRQAVTTPLEPNGNTLASWTNELGPSSPCFCCGFPLAATIDTNSNCDLSVHLSCPHCGASVEWTETLDVRAPEPVLAAA